jgi:septum formation protein
MTASPSTAEPAIILASGSAYRRELLQRLIPRFDVARPDVDESPLPSEPCGALAERLALLKARAIAGQRPGAIVIGSDQVADLGGRALGKPGSAHRAVEQLLACSGRTLTLHTAVCVLGPDGQLPRRHRDQTQLQFRALTADIAQRYVARDQPLDCAGSFKFEAAGIALFSGVETADPTAIQGLPLIWLSACLAEMGVAIL